MEKITYQPLIEHLKEANDFYNELLKNHALQYGAIHSESIKEWMMEIVEPILKTIDLEKAWAPTKTLSPTFFKNIVKSIKK